MFGRKKDKEKIISKYIAILEKSYNDEEVLKKASALILYYKNKGFNFESTLAKQNGPLRALYHSYITDLESYKNDLNNSISEVQNAEILNLMECTQMAARELANLIIEYENAVSRKAEMKKLEKYLTPEEIATLQANYTSAYADEGPTLK